MRSAKSLGKERPEQAWVSRSLAQTKGDGTSKFIKLIHKTNQLLQLDSY